MENKLQVKDQQLSVLRSHTTKYQRLKKSIKKFTHNIFFTLKNRIMEGLISLEEYKDLTEQQKSGDATIPYTLIINYRPLTHIQLLLAFAFDSTLYVTLYFMIFSSCITIVAIFSIYHYIVAR